MKEAKHTRSVLKPDGCEKMLECTYILYRNSNNNNNTVVSAYDNARTQPDSRHGNFVTVLLSY